jgi:hypothetical protein
LEVNYWIIEDTLIAKTKYVPELIPSLGDVVWNKNLNVNPGLKHKELIL